MSEFNLIEEPWIQVRFRDGSRGELGIGDTLARSKEIAEIEDQSPLVGAALHRLLLAVLYRALTGPEDIDQAKVLFRNGLPHERIRTYLTVWHKRFWLFDDIAPFWQVADFSPKEWRAWTSLAAEHNADNAKVLFDHVSVESPGSISYAAAARWLTAAQTFSVSAGKSELAHTGAAPSATSLISLPIGVNLEDTLILALVPQNSAVAEDDLPVWEGKPETVVRLRAGSKRSAHGIVDLYTWQSRAVLLHPSEAGRVSRLAFASGVGYERSALSDPMVAHRNDDKLGRMAMQLRERGLWRDFDSLLPDGADLAPSVMNNASRLTERDAARRPHSIVALGQSANKAKIEFWRAERFSLPAGVAADGIARAQLRSLLADAEKSQIALWRACQSFARNILGHGTRQPSPQDVTAFVAQMPVTPCYWSMLEARFHDLLEKAESQREFEDVRANWLTAIREAIERAWSIHATTIAFDDAWSIRALVKAEVQVGREIRWLDKEIAELTATLVST